MTKSDDGDGWVIPKSALIAVVMLVIGSIGGGGFYMGIQSADIGRMDRTIKSMEERGARIEQAVSDIQTALAIIKSKAEYDVSRKGHGP